MFTAPNDNTGNEVRAGVLADLTALLKGKTDAFPASSFDGATIDGKVYGVPGIIKAVALYYNKSTIPTPPKTTDELLQMVKERQEDRYLARCLPQLWLADRRVRWQTDGRQLVPARLIRAALRMPCNS